VTISFGVPSLLGGTALGSSHPGHTKLETNICRAGPCIAFEPSEWFWLPVLAEDEEEDKV